jgi:hypothetical protein
MEVLINFIQVHVETMIAIIVGFIVSFYFYRRTIKKKKPVYWIKTIPIIWDSIVKNHPLEIMCSGQKVNNLSISKILLCNEGKDTITSTDIAPTESIRIVIDNNFDILDAEIIYQKNLANNFQIKISDDKKSIDISFDYFDFGEGVVIKLLHTANLSHYIKILGKGKTINEIIKKGKNITQKSIKRKNRLVKIDKWLLEHNAVNISKYFAIFVMICLPITYIEFLFDSFRLDVFIILFFNVSVILLFIFSLMRNAKKKIPKGFNVFNEF